jgi:Crinkler effector protein N-terminal domain
MKMLLSRSRLRIGQLKKEVVKKQSAFATIDSNFLGLYPMDIPDANKVDLMASVKAQTLNSPLLPSKSLTNIFPTGPKADTVHFIVEPSKLHV